MTGSARIIRANSRDLPLADDSVDLVVTSPPYFALRSYQDGGEHYAGQIGDEPTPAEFVDSLLEVTRECVRVLKPSGSLWVNLGDKYAGQGSMSSRNTSAISVAASISSSSASSISAASHSASAARARANNSSEIGIDPAAFRQGARNGNRRSRPSPVGGVPGKSLIGIPWRYALRCIDDLGLILRAEVIWSKPNGLPESVTDRVRRSHEQWFHFTLHPRYFSAVDEIREQHLSADKKGERRSYTAAGHSTTGEGLVDMTWMGLPLNPLGKLPGSVWTIPTQPLRVPESLGIDHFAAFPMEWPRRIIQGWAPTRGVCTECGEGRRPVVAAEYVALQETNGDSDKWRKSNAKDRQVKERGNFGRARGETTITGESCACPEPTAPTTPAVVLDPFGGTGTTALLAKANGCHGISVDMSADYCRLAQWRTNDPDQLAQAMQVEKPAKQVDGQADLFDLIEGGAA